MLLDSYAWVEYFAGTPAGHHVRETLDEESVIYTSPTILAEIYSKYAREMGDKDAVDRVAFILEHCAVVPHDADVGIEAGRIHAEIRRKVAGFGMADAFILAAARARGVHVLTGDPHFEGVEDAVLLTR